MSIKTNIIRVQMEGNCYCYQGHFKSDITEQDELEIQTYLQTQDNNLIYAHPLLYTNLPLNTTYFQIILSKGETVSVAFEFMKQKNKYEILDQICDKILRSLQFLPYRKIKTYFNAFEQKDNNIPGIYLSAVKEQTYRGIAFLPINLHLQPPVQISTTKILLNYSNGKFYQPNEVVKVDKQNNLLQFRNGQKVFISNLRKCKVKDLSGWSLAQKLSNYYERVKENCKILFQNWNIKMQANFFRMNGSLIAPGQIQFRQKIDKSLNEIIYPMARNSYNHSFRQLFKSSTFQAILQAQLVLIAPQQFGKTGKYIQHQLQKLIQRMGLKIKISLAVLKSLGQRNQLVQSLNTVFTNKLAIYILIVPNQPTSAQLQNIQFFKEQMINREFYYHLLVFNPEEEVDQLDIVAIRNLAIIYCKMRINPWRIKNLPFTNKPAAVCNIDVQQTSQGKYSIALVLTMNVYFSKFCCIHTICTSDRMEQTIYNVLQQSLNKFYSVHSTYPSRIFVYRTGIIHSVEQQHKQVNNRLNNYFLNLNNKLSSILTYIQLRKKHPFRTYVQSDQNYISKNTVKKAQLLATTVIDKRYYIQLEFQEAPLQLQIFQIENDPSFVQNILLLTVKLCYGSVGNRYGKGLGFLQYASKLNSYRQFNLVKWQKLLLQGVMLFL